MECVLPAERAVLLHLKTLRVVLLVLHLVVVSLLAIGTSQGYLNAHNGTSLNNCLPLQGCFPKREHKKIPCIGVVIITRRVSFVNADLTIYFPQILIDVVVENTALCRLLPALAVDNLEEPAVRDEHGEDGVANHGHRAALLLAAGGPDAQYATDKRTG